MMFEKQRMSGIDMLNTSSSTVDNPSAQLTEAIQNPPAKSEPGTAQMNLEVRLDDPDKVVAASEGGSDNLKETQKAPEVTNSEDLGANVIGQSDSQPAKRVKLNE